MKSESSAWYEALVISCDIIFLILADIASFALRFGTHFPAVNFLAYLQLVPSIITVRIICFYIFSLYNAPRNASYFYSFINIVKAATTSSVVITFCIYFMDIERYPRVVAFFSWLLTIAFIGLWRYAARALTQAVRGKGYFHARLAIVGTDRFAKEAAIFVSRDATAEYDFLGFVTAGPHDHVEVDTHSVLGTVDEFLSVATAYRVDKIIVADPRIDKNRLNKLIAFCSKNNIVLTSTPQAYETIIGQMITHEWPTLFAGYVLRTRQGTWYAGLKRFLDIIASVAILTAGLPLLIATAIAIKLTSPGPVFYTQKRTGLHGIRFPMIKFRTMYVGAEKDGHPQWAQSGDARVTPVGRFLRRSRIDELPQLVNVLRNEMSIIGPRPERPYFSAQLLRKIPFYAERLKVKPGITGWAQVNYSYAATLAASEEKLLYDIFYIQNISLALDLLIAFKTIRVVLTGRGAQ